MKSIKQVTLVMSILLLSISVLSACGSEDSTSDAIGNEVESAVDSTEPKKEKGKNDFNEVELEIIGEKTKRSDDFEITIHSAKTADHIEGYVFKHTNKGELRSAFSGEGKFVIIDATVKNIKIEGSYLEIPWHTLYELDGGTKSIASAIDAIDGKLTGAIFEEEGQVREGKFYFEAYDLDGYTLKINTGANEESALTWDFKVKE